MLAELPVLLMLCSGDWGGVGELPWGGDANPSLSLIFSLRGRFLLLSTRAYNARISGGTGEEGEEEPPSPDDKFCRISGTASSPSPSLSLDESILGGGGRGFSVS